MYKKDNYMELQTTFEVRRSIRKYTNQEVSNETILKLLDAARISPSAKNIQPWKFYVARGDIKNKVADFMKEYADTHDPIKYSGMYSTGTAIKEAPVLLLVFRDNDAPLDRNDTLSIGSAIEHIILKSTEMELGSLWICATYKIRDKVSQLIGTDLELYSCIAIGHPNEQPTPRPRKSLEDIIMNIDELK